MRVLSYDLESTGFSTSDDRVTEIGFVLWDVSEKRPLTVVDTFLWDDGIKAKMTPETVAMIKRVCGITPEMLEEFGGDPKANLEFLERFATRHKVDYLCGHNIVNFDQPFLLAEIARHGVDAPTLKSLPIIDTRTDIPFASEPDSRKLKHLALDIGVINHFPHRAITDALTTLLVLSHYPIQDVLEYQKIPFILVQAQVSYDDRQLAKDQRFSWEKLGTEHYPKKWIKLIKEDKFEAEQKACTFPIVRLR